MKYILCVHLCLRLFLYHADSLKLLRLHIFCKFLVLMDSYDLEIFLDFRYLGALLLHTSE